MDLAERSAGWRSRGWSGYRAGDEPYAADEVELQQDFYTWSRFYRRHFEGTVASRGYPYLRYEPAYYYGYDLAMDERHEGREWNELELEGRREWERRGRGPWEDFRQAVEHAWTEVRDALTWRPTKHPLRARVPLWLRAG